MVVPPDRTIKIGSPLARQKRPSGLPRFRPNPCRWPGCASRRGEIGSLCLSHYREGLGLANYDIAKTGLQLRAMSVDMSGYIHTFDSVGRTRSVHALVMEHRLGRALLPGENVHHINGHKADNRPTNLELWVTAQPSGQRPEDLVRYAREILERYA